MVAPIAYAMGAKFAGDIIGGRKRDKAAKEYARLGQKYARLDDAQNMARRDQDQVDAGMLRDRDQEELIRLTREDELRAQAAHGAAVGYDLQRLRDEAQASGFNPLTVLQMTGAANYARTPAPTLTTPFVGRPFIGRPQGSLRLDAHMGTGQARVETAGYFGDAISAAGSTYIGVSQEDARQKAELDRTAAIREGNAALSGTGGGGRTPFGTPTQTVDARPSGALPGWAKAIADYARGGYADREVDVRARDDYSATSVITDHNGNKVTILNPDVFDGVIGEVYNTGALVVGLGGQQILQTGQKLFEGWQAFRTSRPPTSAPSSGGTIRMEPYARSPGAGSPVVSTPWSRDQFGRLQWQ